MNKKKFFSDIFSPKLYFEAVKQLWKIGIVAFVIFSISYLFPDLFSFSINFSKLEII